MKDRPSRVTQTSDYSLPWTIAEPAGVYRLHVGYYLEGQSGEQAAVTNAAAFTVPVASTQPSEADGLDDWDQIRNYPVSYTFATSQDAGASGGSCSSASETYGSPDGSPAALMIDPQMRPALTFLFYGDHFTWVYPSRSDGGIADVYVDQTLAGSVDQYSASPSDQQQSSYSGFDAASYHVVHIVPSGAKNDASSGYTLYHDAFSAPSDAASTRTLAENDTDGATLCTWATAHNDSAHGGAYTYTVSPGATTSFTFTGDSVTWQYAVGPCFGIAQVVIDGVPQSSVDEYNSTFDVGDAYRATYSGLGAGQHTLRITCGGTRNAASSGFGLASDCFIAADGSATEAEVPLAFKLADNVDLLPAETMSDLTAMTATATAGQDELTFSQTTPLLDTVQVGDVVTGAKGSTSLVPGVADDGLAFKVVEKLDDTDFVVAPVNFEDFFKNGVAPSTGDDSAELTAADGSDTGSDNTVPALPLKEDWYQTDQDHSFYDPFHTTTATAEAGFADWQSEQQATQGSPVPDCLPFSLSGDARFYDIGYQDTKPKKSQTGGASAKSQTEEFGLTYVLRCEDFTVRATQDINGESGGPGGTVFPLTYNETTTLEWPTANSWKQFESWVSAAVIDNVLDYAQDAAGPAGWGIGVLRSLKTRTAGFPYLFVKGYMPCGTQVTFGGYARNAKNVAYSSQKRFGVECFTLRYDSNLKTKKITKLFSLDAGPGVLPLAPKDDDGEHRELPGIAGYLEERNGSEAHTCTLALGYRVVKQLGASWSATTALVNGVSPSLPMAQICETFATLSCLGADRYVTLNVNPVLRQSDGQHWATMGTGASWVRHTLDRPDTRRPFRNGIYESPAYWQSGSTAPWRESDVVGPEICSPQEYGDDPSNSPACPVAYHPPESGVVETQPPPMEIDALSETDPAEIAEMPQTTTSCVSANLTVWETTGSSTELMAAPTGGGTPFCLRENVASGPCEVRPVTIDGNTWAMVLWLELTGVGNDLKLCGCCVNPSTEAESDSFVISNSDGTPYTWETAGTPTFDFLGSPASTWTLAWSQAVGDRRDVCAVTLDPSVFASQFDEYLTGDHLYDNGLEDYPLIPNTQVPDSRQGAELTEPAFDYMDWGGIAQYDDTDCYVSLPNCDLCLDRC